jgi:hypothetical protein
LLRPLAGIPIDGKTVFTSDHALKLEWLPNWIAIIGSGYIGLEFSDVYTALGCEVGRAQGGGHAGVPGWGQHSRGFQQQACGGAAARRPGAPPLPHTKPHQPHIAYTSPTHTPTHRPTRTPRHR